MLTADARAKLNLTLHITGKREDGYHLLDSVVAFTQLADRLQVQEADGLTLEVEGPFADASGAQDDNLVLRAARLLQRETGCTRGAHIRLEKHIPVGAGLGGGSADAAVALQLLNELWELRLPPERLQALAPQLGADVAMCLLGKPLVARGIGEVLEPLGWDMPARAVVLVHPRIPLLTAQVYALRDGEAPRPFPAPVDWAAVLAGRNDLQRAAIAASPIVAELLLAMETTGPKPELVRMTGSGACCFALFADADQAVRYAETMRGYAPAWFVFVSAIG